MYMEKKRERIVESSTKTGESDSTDWVGYSPIGIISFFDNLKMFSSVSLPNLTAFKNESICGRSIFSHWRTEISEEIWLISTSAYTVGHAARVLADAVTRRDSCACTGNPNCVWCLSFLNTEIKESSKSARHSLMEELGCCGVTKDSGHYFEHAGEMLLIR